MLLMVAPGVGDCEGLQDSTDRLAAFGPKQEVEMIGHETIAEKAKRIAVFGFGKRFEKGNAVRIVAEDIGAIVTPVEGMINECIVNRPR